MLKLYSDVNIVYSKLTDSLPITSMRVENKPCVDPALFSTLNNTMTLPNEVMKGEVCEKEQNNGLIHDERY